MENPKTIKVSPAELAIVDDLKILICHKGTDRLERALGVSVEAIHPTIMEGDNLTNGNVVAIACAFLAKKLRQTD